MIAVARYRSFRRNRKTAVSGRFAAVLTLRWRRCTKEGTLAGMVTAFVIVALQTILNSSGIWHWPFTLHVGVVAMAVNLVVTVVVSLFTPMQDKPFMPPTKEQIEMLKTAKAAQ